VLTVLQLLLMLGGGILSVPLTVLFGEVLLAFIATGDDQTRLPTGEHVRVAVVVPAHDESAIIGEALRSVRSQLGVSDRVVVVADNCSDDTAGVAVMEGAEVLVRTDAERRGKGFALDCAIRHLEADPPEVVLIVDADCILAGDAVGILATQVASSGRSAQALYLMNAPLGASLMTRIGHFAWTVKNQVRATGLNRAGLPVQLMGTGMAFPWAHIRHAGLATGHLVEDLMLGIELARAGVPALFCPRARVTSFLPASSQGIRTQRTRWEHGQLGVALTEAPRLLFDSIVGRDRNLLAIALDLFVPPLALLLLVVSALWVASLMFFYWTGSEWPLGITTLELVILACSVLLSWIGYGREIISLGGLAFAVVYALWKIPLYLRFLVARQVEWVRSKRD
jgi:cellulose synthase/poly-beta-1,6-N-acetylglucosamine synthase-like glycosyltransferase